MLEPNWVDIFHELDDINNTLGYDALFTAYSKYVELYGDITFSRLREARDSEHEAEELNDCEE